MSRNLPVKLSEFRTRLAKAETPQELKALRDLGRTAIDHAKRTRTASLDKLNDATECILDAERALGRMLAGMDFHGGDRKSESRSHDVTLTDLGITKNQSSVWQKVAAVAEDTYREWVQSIRDAGGKLSSGGLLKLAQRLAVTPAEPLEGVCGSLSALVASGKRFGTIYADPPWQYDNKATRASAEGEYANTLSLDDICAEPVPDLAADDAHLHLWTTTSFLFDAKQVMDAWGFEYKSCFIWVKSQMGIGNYWRVSHEFLLLGVKGKATSFQNKGLKSWGEFDRTKHSRKPRHVREMIQEASPGPYLELYGRQQIPEWTVYGNQVSEQTRFA
jgi:N6-adenosine-specific RNA methylase IME4